MCIAIFNILVHNITVNRTGLGPDKRMAFMPISHHPARQQTVRNDQGFSLVEFILAIAILGLLGAAIVDFVFKTTW